MKNVKKLAAARLISNVIVVTLVGCGLGGPEERGGDAYSTADVNTDTSYSSDATDGMDSTDASDGSDATDSTDTTDGPDVTDGSDASDATDTTDATDATDGEGFTPCSQANPCPTGWLCNPQGVCVEDVDDGQDGQAGAGCTATSKPDGTIILTCGATVSTLSSCTVEPASDGQGALIKCPNGTSWLIKDGVKGEKGDPGEQGPKGDTQLTVYASANEDECPYGGLVIYTGMDDLQVNGVLEKNEVDDVVTECFEPPVIPTECDSDLDCPTPEFLCSGKTPVAVVYSCEQGSCVSFTESGDPCEYGCSEGACVGTPDCDDGNACTGDAFNSSMGGCQYTTKVCADGNHCTTDSCSSSVGCVFAPNSNSCEDGSACTVGDTCGGGSCHGGSAKVCVDGNVCTTDGCSASSGCMFTANTSACDDGNVCTVGESCSAGDCRGGSAANCDDGEGDTADSCDPVTGCKHVTIPAPSPTWPITVEVSCPAGVACETHVMFNDPSNAAAGGWEHNVGTTTVSLTQDEACTPNGVEIAARTPSGSWGWWCGSGDGTPTKSNLGVKVNGQTKVGTFIIRPWACQGGPEGNLQLTPAALGCPGY